MTYRYGIDDAERKEKYGADLTVYDGSECGTQVARVSVKEGHFEEFIDAVSTYQYLILEGKGTFYLNDEEVPVVATDLVVVPPGTRIYYLGTMDMVLVTSPSWDARNYSHVRFIDKQ